MISRTYILQDIPIEIVDNSAIIEIFGDNRFSDIKNELLLGCGVITKTIQKHEKEYLKERYKNYNLDKLEYIILADIELVSHLTIHELSACVFHELGHIHLGHLNKNTDDYDLTEEIEADNYAVANGVNSLVLLEALKALITALFKVKYRNKTISESDVFSYKGFKDRRYNLLFKQQPVSKHDQTYIL